MPDDLAPAGVFAAAKLIGERALDRDAPTGLTCQRCSKPYSFTDPCFCSVLYGSGWIVERNHAAPA